ncbi:MAG: hypothetical protein HY063_10000 [Bacteroidetes bacterium]|nr:hypothetical protein [Bacteroidota bacterium]
MVYNSRNLCLITSYLSLLTYCTTPSFAQRKLEKEKKEILAEGLALYTLILANWTSNDIYYENEYPVSYVKGYLSYKDKDTLKTIFWRETDTASAEYKAKTFRSAEDTGEVADSMPKKFNDLRVIVKTVRYPKIFVSRKNADIQDEEREPTAQEKLLMDFRKMAYDEINSDTSFFKLYAGTQLKAVVMEAGKEMKVYVYSITGKEDVVPIGGDYLLLFDKKEKQLLEKTALHGECLFISTHYRGKSYDASKTTMHKHLQGASELITPTDIATLLLYKSQLEWDEHQVVGETYTCVFTLVDRKLDIIPTAEFEALRKKRVEQEKEEKKANFH